VSPNNSRSIINPKAFQRIAAYLRQGTLPHALLFTGSAGTGRYRTALHFALACNCMDRTRSAADAACGRCRACAKIRCGTHPDVLEVQPQGPYIRIAQIRALVAAMALKPYEARQRVVIIRQADALNPAAGNAMLKLLEEPPDGTTLILIAEKASLLLPTIVSRCQHFWFNPLPRAEIAAVLIAEEGQSAPNAQLLGQIAEGSLKRAQHLSRSQWLRRRVQLLAASGFDRPASAPSCGRLLALAERIAQAREAVAEFFDLLELWLRDLLVAKIAPARVINQDMRTQIQQTAASHSTASLLERIETVRAARRAIEANANLRLTLESMLLKLAAL
jgi:DNA polymerase-3 subunit delta'